MTIGSQMPELDQGVPPPPYNIGNHNTPYKLGLKTKLSIERLLLIFSIDKYSVGILKLNSVSIIFSFIHDQKSLLFNG